MADRISLFPDDGTYPGYTDTEPEVLTQEQYQAGPVNYFTQVLGPQTGSLKEETGVGVTKAPEVGQRETREDDPSPQAPSAILAATRPTLGGDISESGKISFDIPATNPLQAKSYSEYLDKNKMGDRIPLVNIMEGVIDPDKDVNLFENLGDAVKAGAKRLKDSPGAIFGTTVMNAFGNNSYRPTGLAGAFADMVHTRQYADLNAIRAARAAGAGDTGFAMTLGNFGITRAPGSGSYTGNMRGMDYETVKALEALSKGYDPIRGRYNMLDPSKSQTVFASGGLQLSNNPMDGFFRANGSVYNPRFMGTGSASAAYASLEMIRKAARTYGVTEDTVRDILADARAGIRTVQQGMRAANAPYFDDSAGYDYSGFDVDQQVTRDDSGGSSGGGTSYSVTRDDDDGSYFSDLGGGFDAADIATDVTEQFDFAQGGRVGLAMGGAPGMASGFVERPPDQVPEGQTVADDKKAQLPEGAFVINAAAAEFMGTDDVRTMLLDAHKEALRQGLVVDKQGNGAKLIDVAISRGEVVVAPHLAKIIGYDRLTKINNRGKPETRERIQENGQQPVGVAEGGFIDQPGELGDVGEDVPMQFEIPAESLEKFKKFGVKKQKREDIKTFIKGLSDEEAMALLLLTETSSSVDSLESMEAIGEVVKNRAASDYKDFKKIDNIKDVLLQQTRRGAFQFSGLEPTTLYNRLTEVRRGTATQGLQKTFAAAQNVLSDDPDRAYVQRLPYNTLFYTKSAAPSQWMRQSKDLEFSTEIGGHEFYKPFASPEFP